MTNRTIQLTLSEDLEAEITAAVRGGEYASTDEAIAEALAEWRASRHLDSAIDGEELRRLWREGLDSGAGRDMSIDEIKEEARRRLVGG
jgi:antitoxin ParD1/3/4